MPSQWERGRRAPDAATQPGEFPSGLQGFKEQKAGSWSVRGGGKDTLSMTQQDRKRNRKSGTSKKTVN